VRGSFLVVVALLMKRRRSLAAAIAASFGGRDRRIKEREQKFSLAELVKGQRRRSRLRSCRARSCAGALDATGGGHLPRVVGAASARQRWKDERVALLLAPPSRSPAGRPGGPSWLSSSACLPSGASLPHDPSRSSVTGADGRGSNMPGVCTMTAADGWQTWSTSLPTTGVAASTSARCLPSAYACLRIRRFAQIRATPF
jgi:hypothetical protein